MPYLLIDARKIALIPVAGTNLFSGAVKQGRGQ